MIFRILSITCIFLATACTNSASEPLALCNKQFAGGNAPVVTRQSLVSKTTMLCFEGYTVLNSGVSYTPVWSAEYLTAERVEAARSMKRKNAFHAEQQLPATERSELADYVRSGFDRGHMSPSGDMATESSQQESFSLANMIPQNSRNNQTLWVGIEEATRKAAVSGGELYVVTGPLFEGDSLERINGRVLVPTAVFKALFDPVTRQAGAYVTPNAPGMEYETLSIAELEQRSGLNLFPSLPAELKAVKMAMPVPSGGRGRNKPIEVESLEKVIR